MVAAYGCLVGYAAHCTVNRDESSVAINGFDFSAAAALSSRLYPHGHVIIFASSFNRLLFQI